VAVALALRTMFGYGGKVRLGSATLYGCKSWYVDSVVIAIHPSVWVYDDERNFCKNVLGSETLEITEFNKTFVYKASAAIIASSIRATAVVTNYEDCEGSIEIYDDEYVYYSGPIALKRGVNVIVVEYGIWDETCVYIYKE